MRFPIELLLGRAQLAKVRQLRSRGRMIEISGKLGSHMVGHHPAVIALVLE